MEILQVPTAPVFPATKAEHMTFEVYS